MSRDELILHLVLIGYQLVEGRQRTYHVPNDPKFSRVCLIWDDDDKKLEGHRYKGKAHVHRTNKWVDFEDVLKQIN